MTSTAKTLLEDALALPEAERGSLANALITSLGRAPSTVDQAWTAEALSRLDRAARGETTTVAWDEAMRQVKAAHGARLRRSGAKRGAER